jgi:S-adenosylmethionine synthetase
MIRIAEMVLPGHPDKFCDQVADAIVQACYAADPAAYCQVEMSCWFDNIYLTGGISTCRPLAEPLEDIVRRTAHEIGYVPGNAVDAARYRVQSSVCELTRAPTDWTRHVNDQCVSIGWAGYDARVAWLPPEQFLAHTLGEALVQAFAPGKPLAGQGPDGKLMVRLRENGPEWMLEHVLLTLQQRETDNALEVSAAITTVLASAYAALQEHDRRWVADWKDVSLLLSPNGVLVDGGSHGDNGQTGRKLAVDYYGPRVPIGGGALSGKDLSHIDRAAAYALRQAAVEAVAGGASQCLVMAAWAPNVGEPLDVVWQLEGRGPRRPEAWFRHGAMVERAPGVRVGRHLGRGRHFVDLGLEWNGGSGSRDH